MSTSGQAIADVEHLKQEVATLRAMVEDLTAEVRGSGADPEGERIAPSAGTSPPHGTGVDTGVQTRLGEAARPGGIASGAGATRALAASFVEIVRRFPQVDRMLLETSSEAARVWTIIEAEPLDPAPREAIYEAELEALDRHPGVDVDFRLVNVAEYGDERLRDTLPRDAEELWRR
jgi:hypothetical protein